MAEFRKPKYIETPEFLLEMFEAYSLDTKSNPITVVEQKKGNTIVPKGLDIDYADLLSAVVEMPVQRPLTMEGFKVYAYRQFKVTIKNYFDNQDNAYEQYYTICTHIKEVIRQDQIEGGMAGIYNPSITQRLNNLVEKTETKNNIIVEGITGMEIK